MEDQLGQALGGKVSIALHGRVEMGDSDFLTLDCANLYLGAWLCGQKEICPDALFYYNFPS